MSVFNGKKILVIGASGGLGQIFCKELTSQGATVIGSVRSKEKISEIQQISSSQKIVDLADSSSITAFLEESAASDLKIDGLIVAAGVVGFGQATETDSSDFDLMMKINATGTIRLITSMVKHLTDAESPFVITLSGVIAESPMAGLSAYSASKAALHAYSVAAGREFRKLGIRWIDARPGHTNTGLSTHPAFGVSPSFGEGLKPEAVVIRVLEAIENGERDLPSSAFN